MTSLFYISSTSDNSTVTCETCGRDLDFVSGRTSCPQCRGVIRHTHYPDINFCMNCYATFDPDNNPVCPSCGLHFQNIICKQCGESYRLHPLQTNGHDCPFCGEHNSWPTQGAMATDNYATTEYPTTEYPTTEYPTTEYPTTEYPTTEYPTTEYPTTEYPTTEYPTTEYPTTEYPDTEYPDSYYPAEYTFFFTSDLVLRDRDNDTTLTSNDEGLNIVMDDAIFKDKNVCVDRIEFVVDHTHSYFIEYDYKTHIQLQNTITAYAELDNDVMRIDLTENIPAESRTFPARLGINIQLEETPKNTSGDWKYIYKFPYYQNSKQQPLAHVTGILKELPTSEYPTTEYPTTEYPTTEYPTTEYPTTEYPTTEYPTTEYPTTEYPTTEYPTTEYPTTEYPTTEYPTTEYHAPKFFERTEDDLLCYDWDESSYLEIYNTDYMFFSFEQNFSTGIILDKIEFAVNEAQINLNQYNLVFNILQKIKVAAILDGSILRLDLSASNIPEDLRVLTHGTLDLTFEWQNKENETKAGNQLLPLWRHSCYYPLAHITGRKIFSKATSPATNNARMSAKMNATPFMPINRIPEAVFPADLDSLGSSSTGYEQPITIYPVKNLAASNENERQVTQPCTMFLTDNAWDHLVDVPIPEQGNSGASNIASTGMASLDITFGGSSSAESSTPPGLLHFFHSSLKKSIATPEDLIYRHISQRRLESYVSPTGRPQDAVQARILTEDGFSRITDFTVSNEGERTGHAQNTPERLRKITLASGDNSGLDSRNVHFEETLGDGTLIRYFSDTGEVAAFKQPYKKWTNWQHLENELLIFRRMRDGSDPSITIGSDLSQPPAQYPGYIRQIWTPDGLLDIHILGEYSYCIQWFSPQSIGDRNSESLYDTIPGSIPLKTWTVEGIPSSSSSPNPGNLSELCITEQRGDLRFVTRWRQTDNTTLTVIKGEGWEARTTTSTQEATDIVTLDEIMQEGLLPDTACWKIGETYTREIRETRTIQAMGGSTRTVYRRYPFGDVCLSEERGIGTNTTSSAHYYYDTDPGSRTYGCKLREEHSNGKIVEYNYDAQKREIMKKEPWFNGDFLITRTTYCNTRYNDQRIASVSEYLQSLGDNVPLNRIMHAYGEAQQERWEQQTLLETGYRDGTSRFKPQISIVYWYGDNPDTNGCPCPQAASRIRMKQSADGTQKIYAYESTDEENQTFKCTVTQAVNGIPVPGKSTRTVYYYDAAQKMYRKQKYVHTGDEFSLIAEESYERDISGRIIRTTLPDGRQKTVEWICAGPLEETDENGVTTHYRYDTTKSLVEVTREAQSCIHPGKPGETFNLPTQTTHYSYDTAGQLLTESMVMGKKSTTKGIKYDSLNRITWEADPMYYANIYSYSQGGLTKTSKIHSNFSCITQYHTNGEVLSERGEGQRTRYYTYACDGDKIIKKTFVDAPDGPLESEIWTSGAGHVVMTGKAVGNGSFLRKTRKFDEKGRSFQEQTGDLAPIVTEYDPLNTPVREIWKLPSSHKKRITVTETRFVKTTFGNNLHGVPDIFCQPLIWRQTTVKNSVEGETQNNVAEMSAELISRNIPNIQSATLKRDKYGRETLNWHELSSGKQYQYEIIPESPVRNMTVRFDGWLLYDKRREGSSTSFTYELLPEGERHFMTDERGNTSFIEINHIGQKTLFRDMENKETKWIYDETTGSLQLEKNPLGQETSYQRDKHLNVTRTEGPANYPFEAQYDTADRLVSLKTLRMPGYIYQGPNPDDSPQWGSASSGSTPSPQWDITTFTYDPASGALLKKQMPDGSSISYTYNHRGQILTQKQARGITTTYSYAPGTGELLTIRHSDGTPGITYTYNDRGQIHTITDASDTRTFTYNNKFDSESESTTRNRPTRLTILRNPLGIEAGYELKVNGKAIQHVQYRRDGRARLAGIRQNRDNPYTFYYMEGSFLPEKMDYPHGLSRNMVYQTQKNLPRTLSYILPGNLYLEQDAYSFDGMGRLASRSRTIENRNGAPAGVLSHVYTYNDRSEVISDHASYREPWSCTYDNSGNRISNTRDKKIVDYSTNELNQYTAISTDTTTGTPETFAPAYDTDGNQLSLKTDTGEWTVTWDANNRPVKFVQGQKRIECVYDSQGRRTEKAEYTGSTLQKRHQYIYRGHQLIAEANNRDTQIKTWLWNPAPSNASTPLDMTIIDENYIQEPNRTALNPSPEQAARFNYETISEYPEYLLGLEPTSRDLYFHGYDGGGEVTVRGGGDTLYIEAQIPADSRFRLETLRALPAPEHNPPQITPETVLKIRIDLNSYEHFTAAATWNNGIIFADFAAAGISNELRTFAASDNLNFYVMGKTPNTEIYYRGINILADRNNHSFVQVTGRLFTQADEEDYEQTFYPVDDLPQLHGTPFYYLNDFNKNITAVTSLDGTVKEAYSYDSFGNARLLKTNPNAQQKNPFRFSSEYFDEELGLIYYNYRHYNPKEGRWLSREPQGERESANLYRFVDNNAANTIDNKGLQAALLWEDYLAKIYKLHNLIVKPGDSPEIIKQKEDQQKWIPPVLANGCIGIPTTMAGGNLTHSNCFETRTEAMLMSSSLNMGLVKDPKLDKNYNSANCCAFIYSIHLWNDDGTNPQTGPDLSYLSNEDGTPGTNEAGKLELVKDPWGRIDLSHWDRQHKNGQQGGFDYGYLVENKIYSANHMYNPNQTLRPDLPAMDDGIIFISSLSEWSAQIGPQKAYNTEVWCTECRQTFFGMTPSN